MKYAGQKKLSQDIEKRLKREISISDETKQKKANYKSALYYLKLTKNNKKSL